MERVLFPRKIAGTIIFFRPSDSGHTPFGDIFLSEVRIRILGTASPRHGPRKRGGSRQDRGGAAPIETSEGGSSSITGIRTCNGFVYSIAERSRY
jgi:beta-1,4-mannooligosaccharide/beta-1,4-mannosyl-N-acetylglucosamine phosphorylase